MIVTDDMPMGLIDFADDFDPDLVWHTQEWCKRYHRNGGQESLTRFCIGTYQIHQLRHAGPDAERRASAMAAMTLHWMCAAGINGADVDDVLPSRFSEVATRPWCAEGVLADVVALVQQFCYITTCPPDSVRASRIDRTVIAVRTSTLIKSAMSALEPRGRGPALLAEMKKLVSMEWRSR